MGFISDLLTNISAFRIKIGEKLNWLNANKADTTALADFVKKDGSVPMTGPLTNGGLIPSYKLKTNQGGGKEFEITSAYVTSDSMTIRNVTDNHYVMHFDGNNNVGINTVNPQARLHVNGNAIVADATANNHAVTLGQLANYALNDGSNLTNIATWQSTLGVGLWGGYRLDPGIPVTPTHSILFDASTGGNAKTATLAEFSNWLGLSNYALLSQVYTQSQALALFVGLNGVQTIYDTKTFDSSPIVPNGTLAGHTVNLGQLNTILSSYALASAIPTNNNQLANGANYITATALSGYVLQSSLNTQLTAYATIAGTQTFSGQITFGVAPLVPTGTLSGHTVNLGQMENYVTTQVATQVTNQITNLGFAPKAHDYREITTNNTTVNVKQFRRVVVVLTDPSVVTVELSKDAFPGTVVTIQTTSVPVDVKMGHIMAGAADSNYTLDANRSLQVSFSEDLDAWIVEQDNSLS